MKNPSEVLGVAANADDRTVRRRYLELVRQHPPDQSPERFAEIRAAYDQLRDPVSRLEREIFQVRNDETLEDILADVGHRLRGKRVPVDALLSLGDE
ncbi:MAG: J domain-containing protein [Pirellulaceae bacterium]